MIDNEYSRTKMRGFVMGLEAAIHMVQAGDDAAIFQQQAEERIRLCCEAWNIKLPMKEEE